MMLSREEIQHIANLAKLELTDEEILKYGEQISSILGYIDQLKEVNTSSVDASTQISGLINIWREDEAKNWDKDELKEALNQACEIENNQIKVKRILE